jgi:hypothetical protein
MKVVYSIFNKFKKKIFGNDEFLGNSHYFIIPMDREFSLEFFYAGIYRGSDLLKTKDKYYFQAIAKIKHLNVDAYINSLVESNNGKYKIIEEIPCIPFL